MTTFEISPSAEIPEVFFEMSKLVFIGEIMGYIEKCKKETCPGILCSFTQKRPHISIWPSLAQGKFDLDRGRARGLQCLQH